jgi:hypothetical protein
MIRRVLTQVSGGPPKRSPLPRPLKPKVEAGIDTQIPAFAAGLFNGVINAATVWKYTPRSSRFSATSKPVSLSSPDSTRVFQRRALS